MDEFSAHMTTAVRQALTNCDTEVKFVLAGYTSKLQVMDVGLNRPFKDAIQQEFELFMVNSESGRLHRQDISNWIWSTWESIGEQPIINSLAKVMQYGRLGENAPVIFEAAPPTKGNAGNPLAYFGGGNNEDEDNNGTDSLAYFDVEDEVVPDNEVVNEVVPDNEVVDDKSLYFYRICIIRRTMMRLCTRVCYSTGSLLVLRNVKEQDTGCYTPVAVALPVLHRTLRGLIQFKNLYKSICLP
jgi:hypothetical protein